MKIVKTADDVRKKTSRARGSGRTIGFVPTMGALHKGHLSLVNRSTHENGFTVVSVFVNPAQFGPGEDFDRYPRDYEGDSVLLESAGTDLLFYPDVKEMYPAGFSTWVESGEPAKVLEGERRQGHFRGVCTVVLKLFEIVQPDAAYFGQKDAQQFTVLDRMVRDFNIPVRMVECPIVRDSDGLALSSRNAYLKGLQRPAAVVFYKALKKAAEAIYAGERRRSDVIKAMAATVKTEPLARLDYAEVVDAEHFRVIDELKGAVYILIAGFIGMTRLIDNIKVTIP